MATQNAVNVGIVAGGGQTYTFPASTSTLATIALAETLTSKTLTSPIISGAGGNTAGQHGYDATNKAVLVGDGTANQSLYTSAWKSFTPSWTNVTVGNATNTGAYAIYGKTVFFRFGFTWGNTTSASGQAILTLPVTLGSIFTGTFIATVRIVAAGSLYAGSMGSGGAISVLQASGTYLTPVAISATVPGTFTTNDSWAGEGFYESA